MGELTGGGRRSSTSDPSAHCGRRRPGRNHERRDSSCLMLAAQSGCEEAVRALVAGGANINHSADGVTALMVAARNGDTGIVRLLLQLGADPAARAGRFAAADYARRGGYDDLANLLDQGTTRPFSTSAQGHKSRR
ncbi:ankyrin repeat domain-containing protein [Bradyrhizobium betae]